MSILTRCRVLASFSILAALVLLAVPLHAAEEEKSAAQEEKSAYSNTVKWTTASEVENFGYDVYRGDSEEGPFTRLTASPIPGNGTTDEPSSYQYVDDTIDPYKPYWYYVESISLSGEREKFTPVFKAKAKLEKKES